MTPESKARLVKQLTLEEGLVLYAYPDKLGFLTIGRGRLIDRRKGGGISEDEADYLFANDVNKRIEQLGKYDWFNVQDDVRQAALLDMDFNTDLLNWPHFLGFMWEKHYPAAVELQVKSKWHTQVGPRALRIEKMIETGLWP